MNPYQAPAAIKDDDDADEFVSVRTRPIPSNAFMAVFLGVFAMLPLTFGLAFLIGAFTGPTSNQTAWVIGGVGTLGCVLGIGLCGAASYLWKHRKAHEPEPDVN